MAEVFRLTREALAPADIRRPIDHWLSRNGLDPRNVPSNNRLTIDDGYLSLWTWYTDDEGYVLDDSGERAVRKVTVRLSEPLPPGVAQHLRDYARGACSYPYPRSAP